MNRRSFASLLGMLPFASLWSACGGVSTNDCGEPIMPALTEGPFYTDPMDRSDITEDRTGVALTVVITVEDKTCTAVSGARVDIWHCDKDGKYSNFAVEGTANETWLRGYQTTGSDGTCTFQTIFPGWYDGRLTHIHAKLHIDGETIQTSQLFFPKAAEQAVHADARYGKGQNTLTIEQDVVIDGDEEVFEVTTMEVTGDNAGGYTARYTISYS